MVAKLLIEVLAHEHAPDLVAALGDEAVATYLPAPDVTTVGAMHDRIARLARDPPAGERWLNFAVLRVADRRVIGRLEATAHDGWAEIAYLIGPAYQRRGHGREAVGWLLAHLASIGIDEVWASIHAGNAASIALVTSLGFVEHARSPRPLSSYDAGDRVFATATRRA